MKAEVGGKVLQIFLSSASNRQTGLQTQITKEIVFHILRLEQDTTRKEWVMDDATKSDARDNDSSKYKVEAISDSAVYAKKLASHLPRLNLLVF